MLKGKLVENAVSSFAGYCTDLGLSALINHAKQSLDKGRIRANLTEYILRQRKINDVSILAEEIDFQGLIEYITRQLPDELETRLFSSSSWQRKKARESIIKEALQYSDAKSSESQKRVSTCIGVCLDIIRDYYKKQFTHKDYVLIDEIAQEVVDSVVPVIENNRTMVSCDKAVSLAKKRDFETMEHEITKGLECASTQHPLAPYYGYDYQNRQLISVPNSEEAKRLYPPTLSLSGKTIKVGDSGFIGAMGDPFAYSYRHQLPLTFEVSNAKKYLGKEEDPIQSEATALIGKEIRFEPPEFPDAFPCAIKVGTVVFFEYVLLRTALILDDGTYVINNHEQHHTIQFEFRINPKDPHKSSIKASYNHPSNKERLQYVRFMNTLTHDKDFHIYELSKGVDLLAGKIDGMEYHTAFPSIEEEVDFLERVCAIEDRFSIVLLIRQQNID